MKNKESYFELIIDIDPENLSKVAPLIGDDLLILGVNPLYKRDARRKTGQRLVTLNVVIAAFREASFVPLLRTKLVKVKSTRIRGILDSSWLSTLAAISECLRPLLTAALVEEVGDDLSDGAVQSK